LPFASPADKNNQINKQTNVWQLQNKPYKKWEFKNTSIKPFLKESGSTEKSNFPPFFSSGFASRVQSPSASF